MKRYSLYILTAGIVALVLASLHFGMQSYFNARRLQSELEIMTVRTRTMRVQLGELEQKRRALNRVQHFISQASAMGLNEDRWSRYAVNVEAPLSYAELGRVVEQCTHSRDVYFKPVFFHVAQGQSENGAQTGDATMARRPQSLQRSQSEAPSDVILGLKGVFMVRH
jgi:hypothetical protein